jgi:hypothetical protein
MTVRQDLGIIVLEGDCGPDDAEALLKALLAAPGADIDWSACVRLHTAAIQLILAAKSPVRGLCGNVWLRRWASSIVQH